MSTFQQNPVSKIVWPWPERLTQVQEPASDKPSVVKVLIQSIVPAIVGLLFFHFQWGSHADVISKVLWGIAAFVLVSGLFIPPFWRGIEKFGHFLAWLVGTTLTWGLLVPFFYLVFVPGRTVLKLKGKDPMQRAFPTEKETYWEPRPEVRSKEQYRKQH